jgi:hypothetical protein
MIIQVERWAYHSSPRGPVYRVRTMPEWREIAHWMWVNGVEYLHEFSGPEGYGFSVRETGPGYTVFLLKWS